MAFPDIEPQSVSITHTVPTLINTSRSGRVTRIQRSDPAFTISYSYGALSASERQQLIAHHAQMSGGLTAFYLQLPTGIKDTTTGYSGTVTVDGNHTAGDDSVAVSGTSNGSVLVAGEYISFGADTTKLYTLKSDETITTGSGNFSIYPPLLDDVSDTTSVLVNNVKAFVYYEGADFGYQIGPNQFAGVTLTFKEDL